VGVVKRGSFCVCLFSVFTCSGKNHNSLSGGDFRIDGSLRFFCGYSSQEAIYDLTHFLARL